MEILKYISDTTTAGIVIGALLLLAIYGAISSKNHKLKHYAKQSPAILATVGIFFSFCGITYGLMGLDLSPEHIKDSIPNLLDGLKVKFIASLMGIGASIIVRVAQSFSIEEELAEINVDDKIVNLLGDIHNVLAKNQNNSPEALLQELKQAIDELPIEFRKQTTLLDSIKSSLAGEGDASVTTQLSKLRSDMRDSLKDMDTSNKQRSDTLNSTLTSNFDNLTQKFDEFARIVAENNSKAFIEALEAAMRDFNNNITEQFGENFKQLNQAVGELLKWQENYREHVEQMTSKFDVALKSVVEIQTAFGEIQTRSENFTQISSELHGILEKLDVQLQSFDAYLKGIRLIADEAKEAFPIIEGNLEKLTSGFKKSTEQSLADINSTVEAVGENLVESMGQHKEILQKTIMDTGTILKNTTVTVANNLTATTNTMKSIMEAQQETLSSTSSEFKNVVHQTMNDLSKETQVSTKKLQQAVATQLDNIDANIKQNNALVNQTLQSAGTSFENAIKIQSESMNKVIVSASEAFKKSIQDIAKDFESMAESIAKSVNTQEQTLKAVGQDVKATIDKTLRDLTDQSKASIKEYEHSLHEVVTTQSTTVGNSIKTASAEFNRLLTENTTKSTNVLKEQTELLDKALQAELIKSIGTMGSNLASLSAKFVQDYTPLTERLRDVVRLADDLKNGRKP